MGNLIVSRKGRFYKVTKYLDDLKEVPYVDILNKYGTIGVEALRAVTPVRTGKTAASWTYKVEQNERGTSLVWINTNETQDGQNVVKLLIQGHGTRSGGYVRLENFVNPTIKPIVEELMAAIAKEVKK